jgi:secreted protein with Ig-like and vWFA domain
MRQDAPLNLSIVIDRSTSMNGPRLDQVKQAAHRIIDSLGPDDILSLVSFSDRAEVVFEATPVVEKPSPCGLWQALCRPVVAQKYSRGLKQA